MDSAFILQTEQRVCRQKKDCFYSSMFARMYVFPAFTFILYVFNITLGEYTVQVSKSKNTTSHAQFSMDVFFLRLFTKFKGLNPY